eukprot:CAMPEP_0185614782 /NCGR_PEP_ID=MMETSP0436-20130131/33297_1 /TAXON_ID=626734 ORGANISM="Favella taraikaensis, Strain Fe Narragansett Bay" /NCGR_SAMPLE_ID=MMETSP0436 /ASSEMBLY_ACC=CAM_ASM_000390 /LENGTH=63 /DNA_ID=CAMNT_0028249953 /DNA_START=120 /DNA_END=311 /DNA_ORIENTATION=+
MDEGEMIVKTDQGLEFVHKTTGAKNPTAAGNTEQPAASEDEKEPNSNLVEQAAATDAEQAPEK